MLTGCPGGWAHPHHTHCKAVLREPLLGSPLKQPFSGIAEKAGEEGLRQAAFFKESRGAGVWKD